MKASQPHSFSVVDASIADLQTALRAGTVTSVDLVAAYLRRISAYDCGRGDGPTTTTPPLNAIPILNERVFQEAEASDSRRAAAAAGGQTLGPLEGIPFTVKDSYKVGGMTVASGSAAFQDLVAREDAFTVRRLREAGAVLLGRTNMCPMAAGGMQRGVYGRAESPYDSRYLAAAFASGSSNGSGVATAASFAAFGMGEETVSSGRSPASNNALVAYTPTRGAISIRGNWPLYPTCDVVVPHARTVQDLLAVLGPIVEPDEVTRGDFWRDQRFIELPRPWAEADQSLFRDGGGGDLTSERLSLSGKRIAVPSMYIGGKQSTTSPAVTTCPEVISLYRQAKLDLEKLGASVIEVDEFPALEKYETANSSPQQVAEEYRLPENWHTTERSVIIAYAWEQFLRENDDFNISSLKHVDHGQIYPSYPKDDPQIRYSEPTNRVHYERLQSFIDQAVPVRKDQTFDPRDALMSLPNLQAALEALERLRKTFFDDWLTENNFDYVAFPACGDVGKSDADVDYDSAEYAWRNGVKYSNGNRMLRHLGIPSVTVPMGNMEHKGMPVGLTFLGKPGEDVAILKMAYSYEQATKRRTPPTLTPELGIGKDIIVSNNPPELTSRKAKPELTIEKCTATPSSPAGKGMVRVHIHGCVTLSKNEHAEEPNVEVLIDGQPVPKEKIVIEQCHGTMCGRPVYDFRCSMVVPEPPKPEEKNRVASRRKIARDSTMVVVLAREGEHGWRRGYLKML